MICHCSACGSDLVFRLLILFYNQVAALKKFGCFVSYIISNIPHCWEIISSYSSGEVKPVVKFSKAGNMGEQLIRLLNHF